MIDELLKIIEPISWLQGKWKGHGTGSFPSMDSFEFDDYMEFKILAEAFKIEPLIRFDETAWLLENDNRNFKHWEAGFLKPMNNGPIQFYVCHNTARMEFYVGNYVSRDIKSKSFEILFESTFIRNDEGLKNAIRSKRTLKLEKGKLTYSLSMSTDEHKQLTNHFKVELERI